MMYKCKEISKIPAVTHKNREANHLIHTELQGTPESQNNIEKVQFN